MRGDMTYEVVSSNVLTRVELWCKTIILQSESGVSTLADNAAVQDIFWRRDDQT